MIELHLHVDPSHHDHEMRAAVLRALECGSPATKQDLADMEARLLAAIAASGATAAQMAEKVQQLHDITNRIFGMTHGGGVALPPQPPAVP